jgi:hypothetical protein
MAKSAKDRVYMAKPAVGTKSHGKLLVLVSFRWIYFRRNPIDGRFEHLVVE